jgi:cold shock CspA family protein
MQNAFKDTQLCMFRTETTMSATDENANANANANNDKPVGSRLTGRVKWFNNKTGFGFITALTDSEGVKEGSDVFVHHSAIKVAQEQYRYLVQGEYVEFVLSKLVSADADASASKHEFQAVNVSGVKGGKLICETRWESRTASDGGAGPRSSSNGGSRFKRVDEASSEWTTITGSRKSSFVPRQGAGEWRRGDSSGRGRGRGGRGASDAGAGSGSGAGPAPSSE